MLPLRSVFPLFAIAATLMTARVLPAQEPLIAPAASYPASLSGVTVADLEGDNAPDIIGLDNNSNSLAVLRNLGGGTYGPAHYYGLKLPPNAFAIGDFNGDGKLDVAVALGTYNASGGYVAVFLNAGNGALHAPVYYAVPIPAISIATADFNNDNRPDIAVIGNKDNNGTNTVAILTNSGSSFTVKAFAAAISFTPGGLGPDGDFIDNLTAGDFDGDGRVDLAYIDECTQCDVTVEQPWILANTAAGWVPHALNVGPSGATSLKAADIDGDGLTDLVIPYRGCHTPCVGVDVVFMGKNFVPASVQALDVLDSGEGPTPLEVVVGDFNNDGLADIAGYSTGGTDQFFNQLPQGIMMWTASGPRSFNNLKYYTQPNPSSAFAPSYTAAGFLNKDGVRDLIVPNGTELQVWLNSTHNPADPCPYPTVGGVHVCAPKPLVSGGNVNFLASARTNTQPLLRFELWVDGIKRLQRFSDRMNVNLPIAKGAHTAAFIEVGASGLHIEKKVSFTVGK